jgi:hypothetical protein
MMSAADQWQFVIAAYVLTLGGAGGLTLWTWLAMRKAEKDGQR